MNQCRKPLRAAILSAVIAGTGGIAWADQPTTQPADISQELSALRARIDQLEHQQKEQQLKQQQQEQKATVKGVLNDADKHSQLFDVTGITAGYKDNRFFIGSDDGNFVWRPWMHFQFRGVANNRQDFKPDGSDETETGFEVRRMRFGFDGTLFTPDFQYFANWTTNRAPGNSSVTSTTGTTKGTTIGTVSNSLGGIPIAEEMWLKYNFHDTPFYIQAGQVHDPLLHEEMTSSRYRHSAEISLTGDIFANGDAFTEGVFGIYDPGAKDPNAPIRIEAGVNHGMRSANTNFFDYPDNGAFNAFDWGVAGRAEYKVMGRWRDYGQVAAVDVKEPLLVFGAGADYSERGHYNTTVAALDGMYADQNGLLIYGEFLDRYTNHNFGYYIQSAQGASIVNPNNAAFANKATNEYSALLEAGYMFNNLIEPFGRFEYMRLAGTAVGTNPWVQAITGGVNFWFEGHRLKLTGEVIYLPHGLPFDDTPNDVLGQPTGKSEIVGEFQLQWLL